MKDSKRILIIGFGSIARKHARILKQNWPDLSIYENTNINNPAAY